MSSPTLSYQQLSNRERRHFQRINLNTSGEFVWKTKPRFGRPVTNREFVTTHNLAIMGTKIVLPGDWEFTEGARGRFKLGTEFCNAEILEAESNGVATTVRLRFLGPSANFVAAVKETTAREESGRFSLNKLWS